eukprot:TRINITY_DN52067_c0_g1_i1.p1 TRINITY_DN52067_c0_g1~~TRINITY_DN52067_c0_g1_i1.p1  ORF type:complete len:424 (+),score=117.06 TRINITY_DN52067_c0_g1_i1:161-1432(+)
MSTVYCSQCSVQLSYPAGSLYIQCPKCGNVMNPQAPQQTTCIACHTLLAHPPSSLYIQCPKCLTIMNTGDRGQQQQQQQAQQQTAGQPPTPGPLQPSTAQMMNAGQRGSGPQQQAVQQMSSTPTAVQNQVKPKKKRDPHAPKAASNAYMIFCKEMRPVLKKENTELSFGKIGAKLGEMWRNLSAEGKKPYEDRAAADRERYRKEMENYQNSGGSVDDLDEPASKRHKPEDFSEDEERFEETLTGDHSNFYTQEQHSHATQQLQQSSQHGAVESQSQQHQLHHAQQQQIHQDNAVSSGVKSSPLHSTAGLSGTASTSSGQVQVQVSSASGVSQYAPQPPPAYSQVSPSHHTSQSSPAHHQVPAVPPYSTSTPQDIRQQTGIMSVLPPQLMQAAQLHHLQQSAVPRPQVLHSDQDDDGEDEEDPQ